MWQRARLCRTTADGCVWRVEMTEGSGCCDSVVIARDGGFGDDCYFHIACDAFLAPASEPIEGRLRRVGRSFAEECGPVRCLQHDIHRGRLPDPRGKDCQRAAEVDDGAPVRGHEFDTAVPTGFEPAISSLTGTYARPLHHGTMRCESVLMLPSRLTILTET